MYFYKIFFAGMLISLVCCYELVIKYASQYSGFDLMIFKIVMVLSLILYGFSDQFAGMFGLKSKEEKCAHNLKRKFISCVSHELRTPLSVIISFSELLRNEKSQHTNTSHNIDYISDINDAGKNLLSTVDSMLDIARAEAGLLHMKKKKINLKNMVEEAFQANSINIMYNNISVRSSCCHGFPIFIGDEASVTYAFEQVFSNAVKFANKDGSIEIILSKRNKFFGKTIVVSVCSTSREVRSDQYVPFNPLVSKESNALSNKFGNNGIGYSLAKEFLEFHNIRVKIVKEEVAKVEFEVLFSVH